MRKHWISSHALGGVPAGTGGSGSFCSLSPPSFFSSWSPIVTCTSKGTTKALVCCNTQSFLVDYISSPLLSVIPRSLLASLTMLCSRYCSCSRRAATSSLDAEGTTPGGRIRGVVGFAMGGVAELVQPRFAQLS